MSYDMSHYLTPETARSEIQWFSSFDLEYLMRMMGIEIDLLLLYSYYMSPEIVYVFFAEINMSWATILFKNIEFSI